MRVVVVSHAYVVPENRAVWRRFAELYPEDRITVITPGRWSTDRYGPRVTFDVQQERQRNYEVLPLSLAGGHFRRYEGLARLLRERKPDVFYVAQDRYDWSTLFGLLTCRLVNPRTIIIGGSTINIDYRLTRLHHKLKERAFYGVCNAILAESQEACKILELHGFSRPTRSLKLIGVDEHVWQPVGRPSPDAPLVIGYAGTLSGEKGVADLVQACARLQGNWNLVLIGDGAERMIIEQQARILNVHERVRFVGYLSRSEVATRMRTLHVLVLPSRTTPTWKEQFGLVLIEAMLSGVVVVGSSSGAIPEVIGDAGLIFPEGNVTALATCLQQLYDDPSFRRELASRGRRRALERYSTTALARQFHKFCDELLSA